MSTDFRQPLGEPRGAAAQSLALQPLSERFADRVRQRLAGEGSDLAGQAIGLLILEAQRHAAVLSIISL
jgi:hypothetical protein